MLKGYGGFFESDDGLIPGPGACHPALEGYRNTILASTEAEIYLAVPPSALLTFRRGTAFAEDVLGRRFIWSIWVDQYGRSLASPAMMEWVTYATT